MTVPYTSVVAYHSLTDLEKRQKDVLRLVAKYPGCSVNDVYRIMRSQNYAVQKNSVSPRFTELVKLGKIEPVGEKKDRLTKRMVTTYALKGTVV